jgi:hypothetical protein|tara:strand:+ start:478 stop:918 length:441 start_codon:yes stop_codon:yes gene_type:complete
MKLISHRGNLIGADPEKENHPSYIKNALRLGYDVEIDVWNLNGVWLLGHDEPQFGVDLDFLMNNKLLCHAKNLTALDKMLVHTNIHCFWHQEDHYSTTSRGYIVSYPGYEITARTICMKPELAALESTYSCYGICSDYIQKWGSHV